MHRTLSAIAKNQPADAQCALREHFSHCEMRSTVLSGIDWQDVQVGLSLTPRLAVTDGLTRTILAALWQAPTVGTSQSTVSSADSPHG